MISSDDFSAIIGHAGDKSRRNDLIEYYDNSLETDYSFNSRVHRSYSRKDLLDMNASP